MAHRLSGSDNLEVIIPIYSDELFSIPANQTEIGMTLFTTISTPDASLLPENIQYHVTSCNAYDPTDESRSYQIFNSDDCYLRN